jgi:hypothetical protein
MSFSVAHKVWQRRRIIDWSLPLSRLSFALGFFLAISDRAGEKLSRFMAPVVREAICHNQCQSAS